MSEAKFEVLPDCGENTGQSYLLCTIIGDMFCPSCGNPITMTMPRSGDHFFGKCKKCKQFVAGTIKLSSNGLSGSWELII